MANSHGMQKHKAQMNFNKPYCKPGYKTTWSNHIAYCERKGQRNNHKKGKKCPSGFKMYIHKKHKKIECLRRAGNGSSEWRNLSLN